MNYIQNGDVFKVVDGVVDITLRYFDMRVCVRSRYPSWVDLKCSASGLNVARFFESTDWMDNPLNRTGFERIYMIQMLSGSAHT